MYTGQGQLAIHDKTTPNEVPQDDVEESQEAVKAEEDLKEFDFTEWVRAIVKMIDAENHEEEIRRVRKITKMMRYYRGEQRGFWSASTGEWVTINPDDIEPRDAAMLLINNQMRPMIKSLSKEWSRSRSRMKVGSRDDTVQKKGAARYATARLSRLQEKLMPESFRQTEAKSAFLAGNYLRYSYYNRKGKGEMAPVPKTAKVPSKTHSDYWECPICDNEGDLEQLGGSTVCPDCGYKKVKVKKGRDIYLSKMTNVEKVRLGCPDTRLVDVREVKVHLRARTIEQTPYLRRRQYMLVSTLREQFPWAKIKPTPPGPITRYIQETELSSGGVKAKNSLMDNEEYGSAGLGGMTDFVQLWIRPSLYFDCKAKHDVKLNGGEVIKKGEKFIEKWPNGMYLALSSETLLDVRQELMEYFWTHGAYETLIESFWGDGLDDLIPMQELVNEMQSLFVENIIYNASPKIIYNPFLIESSMLNNNPSEMTPMSRQAKRDDKPSNAVYQMAGMSIARDVPEAKITAVDDMRTMSGAHLAMQGSNDRSLTTATAMSIAREAGMALLGPPLALKSEADVTWAYQILKMCQEYWVDGVDDKALGSYSIQEAKWFRECDLETDLEITVEPGSWTPRTELEIKNDFLTFVTAGGIPLGFANPAVPYEIKQKAAELMRMPIDLDKLQPDIRNANLRIEQIQAAAQVLIDAGVIQKETDNEQVVSLLVADVPVDMYIDEHAVIADTYKAWLKKDEGRFAPVVVVNSVKYLIHAHMQAAQQLQDEAFQAEARYQMAAQALQGMAETQQEAAKTDMQTEADMKKEQNKAALATQQQADASKTAAPIPMANQNKGTQGAVGAAPSQPGAPQNAPPAA
jgi:hypothetical protein